jgi:hypothetical protein
MKPEEYLDRLIESYARDQLPHSEYTEEVAACMQAREKIAQLNEIPVPSGFANSLEYSIRTHVRSINGRDQRDASPARPFAVVEQGRIYVQSKQPRSSVYSRSGYKRRTWMALLQIAAVLIITAVGVLTASTRALPGDALYSLNQAEKQFALTFAGAPQNRADQQIANLRGDIVDLNAVVTDGRGDDAIRMALDTVSAKTVDCQEAVANLPPNASKSETQKDLANVLSEEEQVLGQLLNNADWPTRLALTQQLAALGEPVPTLTQVVVHIQKDGTLLITLSGSYFSTQTQLIINGQQMGIVKQVTPSQLVAVSRNVGQSGGTFAIGVRNPDGTSAQLIVNSVEDNNSNRENDDHDRHGTPVPYPTGSPDE